MKKLEFAALVVSAVMAVGIVLPGTASFGKAYAEDKTVSGDEQGYFSLFNTDSEQTALEILADEESVPEEEPTEAPTEPATDAPAVTTTAPVTTETVTTTTEDNSLPELEEYNVYEALKIKRSVMNNEGKYTASQVRTLFKYLTGINAPIIRYVYYDTEGWGLDKYSDPKALDPVGCYPGIYHQFRPALLNRPGYIQMGWKYEGNVYNSSSKIVMPEYDIFLKPEWVRSINVTFDCGDVDDYVGAKSVTHTSTESISYLLPGSDKLSRKGYKIIGWVCSLDGKTYNTNQTITLPSEDVTYTAVWTPMKYTLTLYANNGNSRDKVNEEVTCGVEYIVPDCEFKKEGYEFAYWKYDGVKYYPGDSFYPPALLNGEKIVFTASWRAAS